MSTRDTTLKRAQSELQAGRFDAGLALAGEVLADNPDDGDAHYIAAVASRYLNRFEAAADHLSKLHEAMPQYGRAWQEQGHLALAQRDAAGALAAFVQATRFNPSLEASWREQARLQAEADRPAEAQAAAAQRERLANLPRELVAVTNHLAEGRLLRAEEICRYYLRRRPQDVEGMRLLAKIGIEFGVLDEAEFLLESAVVFAPDDLQLRLDYIDALRRRQNFAKALEEAEALHQRDPKNPLFQSRLAIESMQAGDYDKGLKLFDKVLAQLPSDPATLTSRGHALKTTGAQADAIASYRAAIAAKPDHG
ncbi:MAG: tetratricopeptide repeat protein, partial [Pseudomonadota bacterium]